MELPSNIINIGQKPIQRGGRIALSEAILEVNKLKEGDIVEVYLKRVK